MRIPLSNLDAIASALAVDAILQEISDHCTMRTLHMYVNKIPSTRLVLLVLRRLAVHDPQQLS
jgi:hypothetical protein